MSNGTCKNDKFKDHFLKDKCVIPVITKAKELRLRLLDESKTEHKLSDATLTPEAEPDPTQLYYVEVKGGLFERRSLNITYSDIGILNKIILEKENKTTEFIASAFKSVFGAISPAIPTLGSPEIDGETKIDNETEPSDHCTNSLYRDIVLHANHALEYIEGFDEKRTKLLIVDKATPLGAFENLKLRLQELDRKYAEAKALFEGTKHETTKTYEITLRPNPEDVSVINAENNKKFHLASFSESSGLCRDNEPSGEMPSTGIPKGQCNPKSQCNKDISSIDVVFSFPPQPKNQRKLSTRIHDSLDTVTSKRGIYYRVPETTRVSIKNGDTDLVVKDVPISQYGKVASLPADTGSSNVTYDVTLDPATGMLRSVVISSQAASTTTGQDFIDPIGNYLKTHDELT